jgi:hypothetical protein
MRYENVEQSVAPHVAGEPLDITGEVDETRLAGVDL